MTREQGHGVAWCRQDEWSYTATGSATLVPLTMPDGEGRFPAFVNMYFPRNEKKNFNAGYFETVNLYWDGTKFDLN